jgi:hypothetical protein
MHSTSRSRRPVADQRVKDPQAVKVLRSRLIGVLLIAAVLAIAAYYAITGTVLAPKPPAPPPPPVKPGNINVDLAATVATLDPAAIGVDESTYGMPSDIADKKAQRLLQKLGVGYARLSVTLADPSNPASRVICEATGCDTSLDVTKWITMMDSLGEVPVIGIPSSLSPAAAAAIVQHLAGPQITGTPVMTWLIGNEPNIPTSDPATYAAYDANFNALYDAMKQINPWIKIGGPATLGFDRPFLQQFLTDCGSRADFIDFHFYPGYPGSSTASQLLTEVRGLSGELTTLRGMIKATVPTRAAKIAIHVGEWNFSSDPTTLAQFAFTGFASVLDADILGQILANGADSLSFSSKNGPSSLIYGDYKNRAPGYREDSPLPLYEAIGMFTGQGLFPHFGTKVVKATSVVPNVDVFASAKPNMIVLVNRGSTDARKVTLRIYHGTQRGAVVWRLMQTGATAQPPVRLGIIPSVAGLFTLNIPANSVTTLVLTNTVPVTSSPSSTSS